MCFMPYISSLVSFLIRIFLGCDKTFIVRLDHVKIAQFKQIFFQRTLVTVGLREIRIRILVVKEGKPLTEIAISYFSTNLTHIFFLNFQAIFKFFSVLQLISGYDTEYLTESVSSRLYVISTKPLTVFVRLEVKTTFPVRVQFVPSMQLSIKRQSAICIDVVVKIGSETRTLHLLRPLKASI